MLLWLHVLASWWLVGVAVTVTLVHYPTFVDVTADRFVAFHARHATGMTIVVALPWLLQGVTAALVLFGPFGLGTKGVAAASVVAVLLTVLLIVPAHGRLSHGFDAHAFARLTRWDRVRLVAFVTHACAATVVAFGG
jgi:hypothetical protein